MPDQYGLDRQDDNGTYLEGPLEGQTSVTVLIGKEQTQWLRHAAQDIGYSFGELVRIAAETAALGHAKNNNLI